VLCLRLLVTEVLDVVGVGERTGEDTRAQGRHGGGGHQALARGGGEESHR
jgi:hypothetical protein